VFYEISLGSEFPCGEGSGTALLMIFWPSARGFRSLAWFQTRIIITTTTTTTTTIIIIIIIIIIGARG
jgi:hypothetical protein